VKNNDNNKLLEEAKEIVSQCDRCGTCLTVCPLFDIQDIEKVSARGKNSIILALAGGGIRSVEDVSHVADFCLLCQTCAANCPNKVKTDEAMMNVRQYLTNRAGGPDLKYKMLGGVMKRRGVVKLAAATLNLIRKAKLNKLVPSGMAPEQFTREQFLKAFAGPAAISSKLTPVESEVSPKARVAYFQGCGIKMMFPEVAAETVKILETTTPLAQLDNFCCGVPHLAHGMREDFINLAKQNISLYEDADIVVADCASCSGMLKHIAAYFVEDHEWKEKAEKFSHKIMDLSEYLVKTGYRPQHKASATITYHDPCHLVRGQGIKSQPRELLKAAGNYVEMEEADRCCGGAGSFHMDYPEISEKIIARKQANIEKTGAEVVVSSCPVCLVQLNKAAEASGGKFKAMHISQVL